MKISIKPSTAVFSLAAITLLAIVVSVALLLFNLRQKEIERAMDESVARTHFLQDQTGGHLQAIEQALQDIDTKLNSAFAADLALDSAPVFLMLNTQAGGLHEVTSLFLVDPEGTLQNTSRTFPVSKLNIKDREYFQAALQDPGHKMHVGLPVVNKLYGETTLHFARAIRKGKKVLAVAVAAVDLKSLDRIFRTESLTETHSIHVYLHAQELPLTIAGSKANQVNFKLTQADLDLIEPELRAFTLETTDGKVHLVGTRIGDLPIRLVVARSEEDMLEPWRTSAYPIGFGALFLGLLVASVASMLAIELERESKLNKDLLIAESRYQHTIDSVMDAIISIDYEQHILLFNPAAERMFGYKAEEVLGKDLAMLLPTRYRHGHKRHVAGFSDRFSIVSKTMSPQLSITGLRADGTEFPIESTISHTVIGGAKQMTAVIRDITERHRKQLALTELTAQLRQLSISLQDVREQERLRISRELHDELGQQLTALKLDHSWLFARIQNQKPVPPERIQDIRTHLDTAIQSVRRISAELRPLILDDLGFSAGLHYLTEDFAKRSKVHIDLHLEVQELDLPAHLHTPLFRIVQESLTNVIKHAHATQVDIRLFENEDQLEMTIADNGVGVESPPQQPGVGLISMRERCLAIGGTFHVESPAQGGTLIHVRVPLNTDSNPMA